MWGVGLLSVFKWWVVGFLVVCCAVLFASVLIETQCL